MPACDARYDVIFGEPGSGNAVGHTAVNKAVVDMLEERLPDEWGEPGKLVNARLTAWWCPTAKRMTYGLAWGKRMALWVDDTPRLTKASRRYLRWRWIEPDPPPHDDPPWVTPP